MAYNGGQIIDCATKQILFEKLVSSEYAKKICEVARNWMNSLHGMCQNT